MHNSQHVPLQHARNLGSSYSSSIAPLRYEKIQGTKNGREKHATLDRGIALPNNLRWRVRFSVKRFPRQAVNYVRKNDLNTTTGPLAPFYSSATRRSTAAQGVHCKIIGVQPSADRPLIYYFVDSSIHQTRSMQAARCTEPPEHITAVRIVVGYGFATVNNAFHLFDRRRRSSAGGWSEEREIERKRETDRTRQIGPVVFFFRKRLRIDLMRERARIHAHKVTLINANDEIARSKIDSNRDEPLFSSRRESETCHDNGPQCVSTTASCTGRLISLDFLPSQ